MLAARIGRAHNAMDLQEYRVAEAELIATGRQFVTPPGVWDFDERWIIHNYSNLIVEARWGESSGTTFGSDQFTIDGWWYSSPIKYNYRIYARTFDSWAEFEDGDHDRRRAAVGGDWREDGLIVFAAWRGGLYTVPVSGGTPELVVPHEPGKIVDFHTPQWLPDGSAIFVIHYQHMRTIHGVNGHNRFLLDDLHLNPIFLYRICSHSHPLPHFTAFALQPLCQPGPRRTIIPKSQ
jgi:hypothetical protein